VEGSLVSNHQDVTGMVRSILPYGVLPSEFTEQKLCALIAMVSTVGSSSLRAQHLGNYRAQNKGDAADVVTDVDTRNEEEIVGWFTRNFPTHAVVGEEGSRREQIGGDVQAAWHVDPLDGTSMFNAGLPLWGISVGFEYDSKPLLGLIHCPALDITLFGVVGAGAWSGTERLLDLPKLPPDGKFMLATEWPHKPSLRHSSSAIEQRLGKHVRACTRIGCTVLDLAWVIQGNLNGFLIHATNSWDVCAGAAIAQAFGLEAVNWHGRPWTCEDAGIILGPPGLFMKLGEMLRNEG
jgi:myo-inositol-1(or 4)-monophosphatase